MDSEGNKTITRKNPRAKSWFLSTITFAWTFDLFRRGFQRELKVSDLCEPLPEHTAQHLGDKLEELWNKELEASKANPKRKPSLLRAIFKAFGTNIVIYMIVAPLFECLHLGQPLLLSKLLQYFAPDSTVTLEEARWYAAGVVLFVLGHLMAIHPTLMSGLHLGMKVRIATSSLIYRKSLRLSREATSEKGAGHLVNILSNDAARFDNAFVFLPEVLLGPFITAAVAYLIWLQAGALTLVGIALFIVLIPLQGALAKRIATLRHGIAVKTDYRIRLMSEIISGIQVIKMYAWEKSFAKLVALARKREVDVIRKKAYTAGFLSTASAFSTKLPLLASMVAYASYGTVIQAHVVYVMVLCYSIIEDNLMSYFPLAISYAAEALVSVKRMEELLLTDEATEAISQTPAASASAAAQDTVGDVEIKDLCAKWTSDSVENTLSHLNVRIQPGSLMAVIGSVGSGKSSFLQLVLQEIPVISGSIKVGGTVSYASQEPWLFGGTVCQNILFGLPMHVERYREVVRVCALEADFRQFPQGDRTTIGDRGVCLSGGQRARVNLARAVYRDADVYLLDDPLSAVDSHVSRHLFDECICGYLSGKTVVLATHHVQRLTNVGHVIKLDAGKVVAQGSFQELCHTGVDLESTEESKSSKKEKLDELPRQQSVLDTSTGEEASDDTEMRSTGKIGASVYLAYLKAVKNIPLVLCVTIGFLLTVTAMTGADYWLSFWVNKEEYVFPEHGHIHVPILGYLDRNVCIAVYGSLIATGMILALVRTILYCLMCMKASKNLHDTMFRAISTAKMHFFSNTPAGQILNRFSRDAGIVDETLPETLQDTVRVGLQVIGSLVIIFVVNWYLIVPFTVVMIVLYMLRQYYVATSRSIKRIESITRSPIYTHVNASLQGLSTIRAMRAQSRLHQEFDHKMDAHSSAFFYVLGTNRAFAYYLDLTCCVYITIVTFSFLVLDNGFLGGDVGVAITQSTALTFLFQWCIRQSAEVENQMTSVERVCEFGRVEPENAYVDSVPDKKLIGWPSRGAIQFANVSLFYDDSGPAVLKNISFEINPGEKIGVVGRTGAGKSSLVSALFRLQKIGGRIAIDGIETGTIGLQDLRSRISIIPQDPVIFSGTMRFNLDPFEEYKDADLWNVLQEVDLKSIVQDGPLGLETNLSEGGVNLSVGQRQLVCLARAILRNSTVLVLDEATANVDTETDDFIQAAIRKRFAHCTVITIAHRLNTIMDSDRILVMDNGRVAEFDTPKALLLKEKGHFAHLVGLAGVTLQNEKNRPTG